LKGTISKTFQYPYHINSDTWVLGNYTINLYLIIGKKKSALIEVGISATVDSVISQLKQLCVKPDYLIVTHPHADHITGYEGLIMEYPEAITILAKGTVDFLNHPKAHKSVVSEDMYMTRQIVKYGITPGRLPINTLPNFNSPVIVNNEFSINLGGTELILFNVQGHSPGDLIGFVPSSRTAIVSDSIGFFFPGRDFLSLYLKGFNQSLITIDKIISLNPAIICPGHQAPLVGLDANIILQISRNSMIDLNSYILNKSSDRDEISESLFKRYYTDELTLYSPSNMFNCMKLLVKRSLEAK